MKKISTLILESKDFDQGYADAIKEIQKALSGKSDKPSESDLENANSEDGDDEDGLESPSQNSNSSGKDSSSGKSSDQEDQQNKDGGSGNSKSKKSDKKDDQQGNGGGGNDEDDNWQPSLPDDLARTNQSKGGKSSKKSGNNGKEEKQGGGKGKSGDKNSDNQSGGGDQSDDQSGNNSGDGSEGEGGGGGGSQGSPAGESVTPSKSNNGQVTASDCTDMNGGAQGATNDKNPASGESMTGDMMSRADGDKIAEKEGYEKEGPSDQAIEDSWEKNGQDTANKIKQRGSGKGSKLARRLDGLYNVKTDWKKELKMVMGRCLTEDETEERLYHKRKLVMWDMYDNDDKDREDAPSYFMIWIDESGSMSDEEIKYILVETYNLALQKKPLSVVIVRFTDGITDVERFDKLQDLKDAAEHAKRKSMGGTQTKECFELMNPKLQIQKSWIKKNAKMSILKQRPELILCFTDGECDQHPRLKQYMDWFYWCIIDNTDFKVQYPDIRTKILHFDSSTMKAGAQRARN